MRMEYKFVEFTEGHDTLTISEMTNNMTRSGWNLDSWHVVPIQTAGDTMDIKYVILFSKTLNQ